MKGKESAGINMIAPAASDKQRFEIAKLETNRLLRAIENDQQLSLITRFLNVTGYRSSKRESATAFRLSIEISVFALAEAHILPHSQRPQSQRANV
jgi:hypothetical protein